MNVVHEFRCSDWVTTDSSAAGSSTDDRLEVLAVFGVFASSPLISSSLSQSLATKMFGPLQICRHFEAFPRTGFTPKNSERNTEPTAANFLSREERLGVVAIAMMINNVNCWSECHRESIFVIQAK